MNLPDSKTYNISFELSLIRYAEVVSYVFFSDNGHAFVCADFYARLVVLGGSYA